MSIFKSNGVSPSEENPILGNKLDFGSSEAYKLLRTNLIFSLPEKESGGNIVGVTSSLAGEGKSTTAINLAYSVAQTGKSVLIIDCDMRRPSIHKQLNISSAPGLSNILAGMSSIQDVLVSSELHRNLYVIPVGNTPPNPSELLGSKTTEKVLGVLSQKFDLIVLDLPPVNAVSDPLVVAKYIDGVIVIVRQDYCVQGALAETIRQLEFVKVKILGFVINASRANGKGYGKYYKYSRYGGRRYSRKYYRRYGSTYGYQRETFENAIEKDNSDKL